jgi:hypothetical protein
VNAIVAIISSRRKLEEKRYVSTAGRKLMLIEKESLAGRIGVI